MNWKDNTGKILAETLLNGPLKRIKGTIDSKEQDPFKRAVITGSELVENRQFAPHNRYLPIVQDALDTKLHPIIIYTLLIF